MGRATSGNHVWLRPNALPELQRVYGSIPPDAVWTVVVVDGGYDRREGLHLELAGDPPRRILAWRSQVTALPRCEYCGLEGHVASKGTAKTCPVRAQEVAELRKRQSFRMLELWRQRREKAAQAAGATPTAPESDPEPPRVAA